MKKEEIAYKLTNDVLKHYPVETLEEKYNLIGGKLITAIYNEILTDLNIQNTDSEPVVFIGEDIISN